MWRDAARNIQAVRQDICMFKTTNRICGLPKTGLPKAVEDECRAIIEGKKPIFPEGYIPISRSEAAMMDDEKKRSSTTDTVTTTVSSVNPFRQDPYLKRIKMKGGAYAILMALHFSRADAMTKAQICSAAQPYCDEDMEPNFSSGRAYGAWSSKKTLINHGLIQERRTTQMGRRGHVCNGVFEYSLTSDGKLFLEALLEKFPPEESQESLNEVATTDNFKENMKKVTDEKNLLKNDQFTAKTTITMPIGKQKNGQRVKHQLQQCISIDSDSSDSNSDDDFECSFSSFSKTTATSNILVPKRQNQTIKPTRMLNSQHHSQQQSSSVCDDVSIDNSDHKDSVTIPTVQKETERSKVVIDLLSDSDSDDEEEHMCIGPHCEDVKQQNRKQVDIVKNKNTSGADSQPMAWNLQEEVVIIIDSRERNRNATPREMRIELDRHISTGNLSRVWPPSLGSGAVVEMQLNYGDFVFGVRKPGRENQIRRLPVSIERKRVSDLVQRSYRADHWTQLSRMRDCCTHAILLVEGNTSKTAQFSSYDNLESEDSWNPDHHAIDDEHAFYRFLGRAVLSSQRLKIWQTRDEQATYRSVGAVAVIAALMREDKNFTAPASVVSAKVAINKLYDKLKSRGIPWQIARRVSEELGSISQLDRIFCQCERASKTSVLVPIINESCSSLIKTDKSRSLLEYGTVDGWSEAITSAWFSKLENPLSAVQVFDEYKEFANDRSKLLSEIHSGKSGESAVHESNRSSNGPISPRDIRCSRKVRIEAITHLAECFPQLKGTDSFYEVESTADNPLGLWLPSIVLQTFYREMTSHKLVISVIEGTMLIERIQHEFRNKTSKKGTEVATCVAKQINNECSSFLLRLTPPKDYDRRVLIVRGLAPALDSAAKCSGYLPELKVTTDLVLAELMLKHNIVVLQALRRKGCLEMIVREFAMSCFYYQLTTKKARS